MEAVPTLAATLGNSEQDAQHAAVAITTTDLVSKSAALEVGPYEVRSDGVLQQSFRSGANRLKD